MASARGIRAGAAYIELFVNDSKLVRGLEKASKKLKAFGDAIAGWGRQMAAIGSAVAASLVSSTRAFSEMGDRIAKASVRTGIPVEALSELSYAADLSGTSLEALEMGLRHMQRTLVEAAQGSRSAGDALAQLGLRVGDLRGLSPQQQLKLIADRLANIKSPALRAAAALNLLGRGGTQLLPMMKEGAKGIEALRQQARDLGLTLSSESVRSAEALNDTFDTLWRVLKQGVFIIGSALAPAIQAASERVIQLVVSTTAWINRNKQLVVMILKVSAGIVAGGLALVALGYTITTLSLLLRGLAGAITLVGTALRVMGSILATLASPIGLTIASLAALGAYLIHVSGVGGSALSWLGDRFAQLSDFAAESFRGIGDALMAGDIALAARVLWLSLKVLWQKGVLELNRLWENLENGSMKVAYGMWYGLRAAWEIGSSSVAGVMLRLYYGILEVWERLSSGVMKVWDSTIDWVAKRIVDLWGLVDESIDTTAIKGQLEADARRRRGDRDQEKNQNLQRLADEREESIGRLQQEHEQVMARIGQASIEAESRLDAEAQKRIDASAAELEEAKKEWKQAIGEAGNQRRMKESNPPQRLRTPPDIGDYLEGLGPAIEQARQQTIRVIGTFNAMGVSGLAGGQLEDRIATAAEETAKNTRRILQETRMKQLTFE